MSANLPTTAVPPLGEAIACHQRAVALAPDSADYLFNLAVAYSAGVHSAEASDAPYIRAPLDRVEKARAAIGDAGGKLKVGIVWSGSTTFKGNHDRAVALRMFLDAFAMPGVQLYSMQKGPPAAELKAIKNAPVIDLAPMLDDFPDAAAVVSELDLIIMTDSAVAHLAGALGKPVWVLVNYAPYWMWMDEKVHSPWYETVSLFRQREWGNWEGTFDNGGSDLMQKCSYLQ